MYEYLRRGLGWSELSWWEKAQRLGIHCNFDHPDKPRPVCFEDNSQDEQIANVNRCVRYPGGSCERNNRAGSIWCCPEGYPREYMQDIPSDVAIYEEERRRLLEQEPVTPQPTQSTVTPSTSSQPAPVSRHTFLTRLTHPGAIAAITLLAGGGAFFYLMRRRQAWRYA